MDYKTIDTQTLLSNEFYQAPKWIMLSPEISNDAKILYIHLYSRYRLSAKNGWQDKNGLTYCFFPRTAMANLMSMSERNVIRVFNELKDIGVITVKRGMPGQTSRVYLNAPTQPRLEKLLSVYGEITTDEFADMTELSSQKCQDRHDRGDKGVITDMTELARDKSNSNYSNSNISKSNTSKMQSEKTTSKEVVISKEFKDSLIEKWNSIESIPNIKALRHGTKRYDSLKARLDEFSEDEILQAINNITKSDFLQGKNNRGWTITFDWFVKPNNFIKVLENQYKNNETKNNLPAAEVNKKESWIDEDMEAEMKRILGD